MKKLILTALLFLGLILPGVAQLNPVTDLYLEQDYSFQFGNSLYMSWQVPEPSSNTLVGYNVYRDAEFYRFQEETELYFVQFGGGPSNCGLDFITYNGGDFYTHVTAVYDSEHSESIYTDSAYVHGPLLNTEDLKAAKPILYPNPTTGIINLNSKTIKSIIVYDIRGNVLKTLQAAEQIDLSSLAKGVYIMKLISENRTSVEKVIID